MSIIRDRFIEPYYIETESDTYILKEVRVAKKRGGGTGTRSEVVGYFSTLSGVLKKLTTLKTNERNHDSIQEYIYSWDELSKEFTNKIKL